MSETTRFAKRDKSLINLKAINYVVLMVVVIAALAFPVYWKAWEVDVDQQLARFAQADPYADAREAIDEGKLQFIAIRLGDAVEIWGVDPLDSAIKEYGYARILEPETGYEDLSPHDRAQRKKAFIYIEAFNKAIYDHIKTKADSKAGPV